MKAATDWILFSQDDHLAPRIGEWCLWSIVTDKGRENYSGTRMGIDEVYLEGFPRRIVSIDKNTHWARVYLMPYVAVITASRGTDKKDDTYNGDYDDAMNSAARREDDDD